MIYWLYHIEQPFSIPLTRTFADQVAGYMFGFRQVIVDMTGEIPAPLAGDPIVVPTLDAAREHPLIRDLRWVFFHAHAQQRLREYVHPADDAVYCLGSDWAGLGYGPDELATMGDVVRVDIPGRDHDRKEFFTATLLPIISYDRALKAWWGR